MAEWSFSRWKRGGSNENLKKILLILSKKVSLGSHKYASSHIPLHYPTTTHSIMLPLFRLLGVERGGNVYFQFCTFYIRPLLLSRKWPLYDIFPMIENAPHRLLLFLSRKEVRSHGLSPISPITNVIINISFIRKT